MIVSAQQLADRYQVSKAAILNFVKENTDIINKTGQNAYQTGSKRRWEFTDEAVKIIDSLRKVDNAVTVVQVSDERLIKALEENAQLKTQLLLAQAEIDRQKSKLIDVLEKSPVKEVAVAQSELAVKNRELEIRQEQLLEIKTEMETVKERAEAERLALSKADQLATEATIRERKLEIDLALAKEKITHEQDKLSSTEASLAVEKQAKENAERNLALANNQIAEKDNELEKLKQQITEERNKSFWKRLFG